MERIDWYTAKLGLISGTVTPASLKETRIRGARFAACYDHPCFDQDGPRLYRLWF